MSVYLIHLDSPIAHAQHYLGYARNVAERLAQHQAGTGARLLNHANLLGIDYDVARTWPGASRTFERQLKNRKETPRLCPICNPQAHQLAREIAS